MLKTSNFTLKSTRRAGNPGNVLLTSRICLKYFYQWIPSCDHDFLQFAGTSNIYTFSWYNCVFIYFLAFVIRDSYFPSYDHDFSQFAGTCDSLVNTMALER